MANESNLSTRSATAGADLSASQFKFVELNSSEQAIVVSAAGVDCFGVLQNDPESGQQATIAVSGCTNVIAGAALAVNDEVSIDSSGRAVPTTTGASRGLCRKAAGAAGEYSVIELYPAPSHVHPLYLGAANVAALTGNTTLTTSSAAFQKLDPGGASRDVTLPATASSVNRCFFFSNAADAAENLVIKNAAAATIVTLNQNEAAFVVCDGTTWSHLGVITIAQS